MHPCLPVLCVKVLCGAVTQAGKPGKLRPGEGKGLVQGHTHLLPMAELYLPASKDEKGFGDRGLGQLSPSPSSSLMQPSGGDLPRDARLCMYSAFSSSSSLSSASRRSRWAARSCRSCFMGNGFMSLKAMLISFLKGRYSQPGQGLPTSFSLVPTSIHPRMVALPSGANLPGVGGERLFPPRAEAGGS